MVIEQVITWVLVVQQYFFSLCRYVAVYVKRFGSLTIPEISGKSSGGIDDKVRQKIDRRGDGDGKQTTWKSRLKNISEIPGPRCLPVVGSLFEFNKFGPRRVHELSKERHQKYGDIFREKLLTQEIVFMANADLMKQWMSQEGKMPSSLKQEPALLFAELYPQLKRGLFFRNGVEWQKLRKLGHAILGKNASDFDFQGLFDACQHFMEKFIRNTKKKCTGGNGGTLDVEKLGYEIAVGALLSVCYGSQVDKLKDYTGVDFDTIVENSMIINIKHQQLLEMPTRIAKWFNSENWQIFHTKLSYNLETCIKFGQILRDEIKANADAYSMRTHGLLHKTINFNADTRDIDDLLADFAVDTKDPFAGTTMFVTLLLSKHQHVQEKILEEINQVYPNNEPITYGKLRNLEYTDAFFREALRLYPVAAFTSRVTLEDTVIGEYLIPPGTLLLYSTWVAQHDPRYFSDPEKLIPERWLKKETTSTLRCESKAFAAFGLGQRICIGQYITYSINVMYIANLVRNFTLHLAELPEVEMQTVLYPKNPQPINFRIRK